MEMWRRYDSYFKIRGFGGFSINAYSIKLDQWNKECEIEIHENIY
jgi:hypothetical protein